MESREGEARRLGSLDTLRGVAILCVVLFHVSGSHPSGTFAPPIVRMVQNQGVQLFFLVSAYTMGVMWWTRRDEPHRTAAFYIRRLCRIAPVYLLAILLYGLLRGFPPIGDVVANMLLIHSVIPSAINSVVPGGWSIGVEIAFYLFFPLLVKVPPRWLPAIGFAWYLAFGVAVEALFLDMEVDPLFLFWSPFTQFPVFALGLYVHAVNRGQQVVLGPNLLLVAGWLVAAVALRQVGLPGRPTFWAVVFALAALVWATTRWSIAVKPLELFGRVSYSMYLVHFAVIDQINAQGGNQLGFLVAAVATVAVSGAAATLSFHTGERWSQALARTLVRRLRRASGSRDDPSAGVSSAG